MMIFFRFGQLALRIPIIRTLLQFVFIRVQAVSEAKLAATGRTREERKRKQKERGERIRQCRLEAKERCRATLSNELTLHRLSYQENCRVASAFISGL
jgi:hypothetical protein